MSQIESVNLNEHQVRPDRYDEYKRVMSEKVRSKLVNADVQTIDIFNMKGESTTIYAGSPSRLVIMVNHPQSNPDAKKFEIDGVEIANFVENNAEQINQLNIFPDLLGDFNRRDEFDAILSWMENTHYLEKVRRFSWKLTSEKETLTKNFVEQIKTAQERIIRSDIEQLSSAEQAILDYTLELKRQFDKRTRLQCSIQSANTAISAVTTKLIADLDNIVAHPKVANLTLKDNKFIVNTAPLYAYHDKTGERYYIGNMRIEMKPDNTEIKFFGDNPRRSHWTTNDPHPHVNGRTGNACLGSLAPTVAELCSQMEIYALTLMAIDFLESVNTDDTAGKHIVNWDMVDEEGNIIEEGRAIQEETNNHEF